MIIELLAELEKQGHSGAGIARKLGVSRRSVTRWREGVEPLDYEKIELMLKGMLAGEYVAGILNRPCPAETKSGNRFDQLRETPGPSETNPGNIFDQLRRI